MKASRGLESPSMCGQIRGGFIGVELLLWMRRGGPKGAVGVDEASQGKLHAQVLGSVEAYIQVGFERW